MNLSKNGFIESLYAERLLMIKISVNLHMSIGINKWSSNLFLRYFFWNIPFLKENDSVGFTAFSYLTRNSHFEDLAVHLTYDDSAAARKW